MWAVQTTQSKVNTIQSVSNNTLKTYADQEFEHSTLNTHDYKNN